MPRPLRRVLQAFIVLCHVYLLAHSQEPLRLNVGDPWSDANVLCSIRYVKDYGFLATSFTDVLDVGPLTKDSYRYTHYPPLAEITYGAIGKFLGASAIGTFRVFAIAFSALAMVLLFAYTRRMWDDSVAWIATALWSGSLLWMTYADSIHQAPILQCATFLGLWGLERAIETRRPAHWAAAIGGAFACFLTSYDGWILFPAMVLFTVYRRLGNPFGRAGLRFVLACAGGCLAAIALKCLFVIGALGWHGFVVDLKLQLLERTSSTYDRNIGGAVPTIVRRITLGLSPLVWVTLAYHAIRAIRAPSLKAALDDGALWLLVCALAFLYVFEELAASQWLPSQVVLPFYAIGSALVIMRLLRGARLARIAAYVWLAAAALWMGVLLATHQRSLLPVDDVTAVRTYLAEHDRNDFVVDNLAAAGIIQAAFGRHSLTAPREAAAHDAQLSALDTFDATGATAMHAIIFKHTGSRFIDKTLWPLAAKGHQWAIAGMPWLWRAKTNRLIAGLDAMTRDSLAAVGAVKVYEGQELDLYRIDRATVVAHLAEAVPAASHLDLGSVSSLPHLLVGWTRRGDQGVALAAGRAVCPLPRGQQCKTVLTNLGIEIPEAVDAHANDLLLRVTGRCDVTLHVGFGGPASARLQLGERVYDTPDFATAIAWTVPRDALHAGVEKLSFAARDAWLQPYAPALAAVPVATIDIDESCPP